MQIRKGVTRRVFLIGNYAVKIPNHSYSHNHFLHGCYCNWKERKFYKDFKKHPYGKLVSPSIFCSFFGLIQIQKRCAPYIGVLSESDKKKFKPVCQEDNKGLNFGWYKGELVCLDYA